MEASTLEAIEAIDAAIFSGDEFLNAERIKELREYLERWERGLKEHESVLNPPQPDFFDQTYS